MIDLKVKFDLAMIFFRAVPFFFSFLCIRIVWFFSTCFVFGIAATCCLSSQQGHRE